jgi:hypothetical protein
MHQGNQGDFHAPTLSATPPASHHSHSTAHRHRVVATQDASGILLIFASASHILNQIKLAINTPVPYIFNCTVN